MIHDSMPYDPNQDQDQARSISRISVRRLAIIIQIQIQVKEVRKLRKWPISESETSVGMHTIKRLMMNYDAPTQYLNFDWTDC